MNLIVTFVGRLWFSVLKSVCVCLEEGGGENKKNNSLVHALVLCQLGVGSVSGF